jgi:DNA polymerase-3 subunit alpha
MNRAQMLYALSDLIEASKDAAKNNTNPIVFVSKLEDISEQEKSEDEYESLGFFISHNPLEKFKYKLDELVSTQDLEGFNEGTTIKMGGLMTNLKEIVTKTKKQMAFFDLEDLNGRVEVVAFSSLYLKNKNLFVKNKPVQIVGKLEIQTREINEEEVITPKIILMAIYELEEVDKIEKLILNIKEKDDFQKIHDIILSNSGNTDIEIEYENAIIKTNHKISSNKSVLSDLENSCLLRRVYGHH